MESRFNTEAGGSKLYGVTTYVPSKLRACAAVALPRTSLTLPRTLIGLVYSQLELIKANYKFLLFGGTYKM
jgi:hypothetical protein